MKDLAGKVAFITGSATGMGLGMARAFAVCIRVFTRSSTRARNASQEAATATTPMSSPREEFLRTKILPAGMDRLEVGERVLRGIRNNDLYILTHHEYATGFRERADAILASFPHGEPEAPAARVAAEAMALRHPMYARDGKRVEKQ